VFFQCCLHFLLTVNQQRSISTISHRDFILDRVNFKVVNQIYFNQNDIITLAQLNIFKICIQNVSQELPMTGVWSRDRFLT